MKFALILSLVSISAADPEPSKPFELTYDYNTITPVCIYVDGTLLKQYLPSDIMWIRKATTGGAFTNTYAVTIPPLNRAEVTLTATALFWNGTNLIESAQSEPLLLQFRPHTVSLLQTLDLINDDDAIERIVKEATRAALAKNEAMRSLFEDAYSQLDILSHATIIDSPAILIKRYQIEDYINGEASLLLKQFERGDAINPRAVILSVLKGLRGAIK